MKQVWIALQPTQTNASIVEKPDRPIIPRARSNGLVAISAARAMDRAENPRGG